MYLHHKTLWAKQQQQWRRRWHRRRCCRKFACAYIFFMPSQRAPCNFAGEKTAMEPCPTTRQPLVPTSSEWASFHILGRHLPTAVVKKKHSIYDAYFLVTRLVIILLTWLPVLTYSRLWGRNISRKSLTYICTWFRFFATVNIVWVRLHQVFPTFVSSM